MFPFRFKKINTQTFSLIKYFPYHAKIAIKMCLQNHLLFKFCNKLDTTDNCLLMLVV